MDHDLLGPSPGFDRELVELPATHGAQHALSDGAPMLVRPVARLRSPAADHRSGGPAPEYPSDGRPGFDLPPLAALLRPVALALLPAAPVLALVGWQVALGVVGAAFVIRLLDNRVRRISFRFADGFLPYRSQEGWPRGLQEDDDVRWNWAPVRNGHDAGS